MGHLQGIIRLRAALTQKRWFLVNWTSFSSDFNVGWKQIKTNIQNSTLNSSFASLSKRHDPHIRDGLAIIFVDKQEHADSLLKDLMNAKYENTGSLHGGIDQYDRDR